MISMPKFWLRFRILGDFLCVELRFAKHFRETTGISASVPKAQDIGINWLNLPRSGIGGFAHSEISDFRD